MESKMRFFDMVDELGSSKKIWRDENSLHISSEFLDSGCLSCSVNSGSDNLISYMEASVTTIKTIFGVNEVVFHIRRTLDSSIMVNVEPGTKTNIEFLALAGKKEYVDRCRLLPVIHDLGIRYVFEG
jgi:hypothetical protein